MSKTLIPTFKHYSYLYPKRRAVELCQRDSFRFKPDSVRLQKFGSLPCLRRGIITASQFQEILGCGFRSRAEFMRKLAKSRVSSDSEDTEDDEEEPPAVESDFTRKAQAHGRNYESDGFSVFLECFNPVGRFQVHRGPDFQYTYRATVIKLDTSDEFDIAATPDAIIWDLCTMQAVGIEIKCPYFAFSKQVNIRDEADAWRAFRYKYYVQIQYQMLLTGLEKSYLVIYIPRPDGSFSDNIAIWKIKRDEKFMKFILSSVWQALQDIGDSKRYNMFKHEKEHNNLVIQTSLNNFCKFLKVE